jgi:4-amino-4-deoxy-L-arabinose transferase-like glycosyltransferase
MHIPSRNNPPHSNVLLLSILTVWVWVGVATLLNESQLNDSLEQFIWAQSFEWGYWKHPPVTTWLMYIPMHLLGPSPLWTYVLSALLFGVTVFATHRIAGLLFNAETANWTALLLTLHYGFTRRAQLYNHNSVLIAFMALTVLVTLYALRDQKNRQWICAGLLAGLSLLVKYQAAVPLLGMVLAIVAAGQFRSALRGILLALAVCLLTLAPHISWVWHHDFQTIAYALHYIEGENLDDPTHRQGAFWVAQVRYHLPMLFFIFSIWAARFIKPQDPSPSSIPHWTTHQRGWMVGLILFPLAFIVFISFAMGVRVQSQWGLQTTQFLSVPLAFWLLHKFGALDRTKLWLWGLIQAIAMFIFIGQGSGFILYSNDRLAVRELPAHRFASEALTFWRSQTHCPLKYLSGDSAMSALISAYSGQNLLVLEDGDPAKSPWIDLQDMARSGHLLVSVTQDSTPRADTRLIPYKLRSRQPDSAENHSHLALQFRAPTVTCP